MISLSQADAALLRCNDLLADAARLRLASQAAPRRRSGFRAAVFVAHSALAALASVAFALTVN